MPLNPLEQRLDNRAGIASVEGEPCGCGASFPATARAQDHDGPEQFSDILLRRAVERSAQHDGLGNPLKGCA